MIVLFVLVAAGVIGACLSSASYVRGVEATHLPSGKMISVNGSDMHVIEAGDAGPVVVMIHGASANAREFTWTLTPELTNSHRILMVDRPGHGYSDRLEGSQMLGVQAAQVAGTLKTLAPGEKAVIVGHSFGGAVALRLALDFPELVGSLVLLAPVSHDWGGGGEAWYNGYAANPIIGPAFSQLVPIVGPKQVKNGIVEVFAPQPAPEGYYEASAIGLLFRPHNFRANAADVTALREELAAQQGRYDEINVPVVVYSGAQDTVIKPQLHVGKLKHQVEGLELVALRHEGHMPHHGEGEVVAEMIRALSQE